MYTQFAGGWLFHTVEIEQHPGEIIHFYIDKERPLGRVIREREWL